MKCRVQTGVEGALNITKNTLNQISDLVSAILVFLINIKVGKLKLDWTCKTLKITLFITRGARGRLNACPPGPL